MPDLRKTVLERDLNPYHSFLASFFAGLAEMGMLNQGSINIVSKRAAEYLYAYLEAKEILPDLEQYAGSPERERVEAVIEYLNSILSLMGGYHLVQTGPDQLALMIAGKQCRICPKGVGGAAIEGTFCPIPNFIESLVNRITREETLDLVTPGIEKEGTTCKAVFQLS
jgi:hypothetical protein